MHEQIKIVLVDDHHIVRKGIKSVLEMYEDMLVIGEAASGEEALRQIEVRLPDVVVMDMLMPGGIDGVETIRRIRDLTHNVRIVVLTSYADDVRVVAALRAGAIGYVRKEADPELLFSSIRAAMHGQTLLEPAIATILLHELTPAEKQNTRLTEREHAVLRQIALGQTNRQIADTLAVSEETIKTHIGNILTKLQLAHRTQAAIYALKKGMITLDEIHLPFPQDE